MPTRSRRTKAPSPVSPHGEVTLWQEAAAFAARAHRNQHRKDLHTPYFSHVARVAMTVSRVFGCDDDVTLAAAFLHDTIEDTTTDYDDLEERFGGEVARIVANLTKNMAMPERAREADYLGRLAKGSWRTTLVKLADTYDNLCDARNYPEDKRAAHLAKTRAKAAQVLALADRSSDEPERLTRAIRALRALLA
ncbi:guanosine-3',5'-bis(diphosphate) 3'-pyrophosphohydrolase [Phycisphaerales bacterium]|nr:guanosine-3',5'-bis(diphosphate) 3'-pyrophosphohydrolase [Phycisphaerales bacterium]